MLLQLWCPVSVTFVQTAQRLIVIHAVFLLHNLISFCICAFTVLLLLHDGSVPLLLFVSLSIIFIQTASQLIVIYMIYSFFFSVTSCFCALTVV